MWTRWAWCWRACRDCEERCLLETVCVCGCGCVWVDMREKGRDRIGLDWIGLVGECVCVC